MMKKLLMSLFLLGVVGIASASDDISQSHKNAALELLSTMKMGEQFSGALETSIDAQLKMNPSMARYRQTFLDFYDQYVRWEDVKERFAMLYAKNFTQSEIEDINDFYSTQTGQKVALLTTTLMEEGMRLGEQLVLENQSELVRMIQEADKQ
ncbi:DUF2059 domain-containing protein [Kangiella geojedonensis]|nr:DUF2059 domain-containing protein [Kangiella geojedonensis]